MPKLRVLAVVLLVSSFFAACARSEAEPRLSQRASVASSTTVPTAEEAPPPEVPPEEVPGEAAAPAEAADNPLLVGAPRPPPAARKVAPGRVRPTGHIDIPAIGLSHPTFEGVDLAIINHGPSHWPGTAMPGERGNTVFPGHRTTYSRPFWDIDRLAPGHEVIFTTPAGRFTYRVTHSLIVGERDSWIIRPTDNATFTIFACHPKGSARQRYVVKGELVGTPIGNSTTTTSRSRSGQPPPRPAPTSTTTTAPPSDRGLIPDL